MRINECVGNRIWKVKTVHPTWSPDAKERKKDRSICEDFYFFRCFDVDPQIFFVARECRLIAIYIVGYYLIGFRSKRIV